MGTHSGKIKLMRRTAVPLSIVYFIIFLHLKETQLELDHLINSIPGGIASYRVESGRFIPTFFSDGVPALSGHTRAGV